MKIAVLLHSSIKNDYRVLKTVETLSSEHDIDIYYIGKSTDHEGVKINNTQFFAIAHKNDLLTLFLRHSLFCYEFKYIYHYIISQGIQYDIIWANDLPTLSPGYLLAKRMRSKLFFDSHEIYTETLNQFFPRNKKGIKSLIFSSFIKLMRWHGRHIEGRIIPHVNLLITVNQSLSQFFNKNYDVKKTLVLMNLPRLKDTKKTEKIDFRRKFNWPDSSKIIIYQGALNEGRGLHLLIRVMNELAEDYKLIIIGDGTIKTKLIKLTKELNILEKVVFIGRVELNDLPSYTKGADIGINLLESFNLSKKLASPNKLFEYIHAGIPVVASKTKENVKVVEKYKVGRCCDNRIEDIKDSILEVINNDYGTSLIRAKKRYNWEAQENLLLKAIYE